MYEINERVEESIITEGEVSLVLYDVDKFDYIAEHNSLSEAKTCCNEAHTLRFFADRHDWLVRKMKLIHDQQIPLSKIHT